LQAVTYWRISKIILLDSRISPFGEIVLVPEKETVVARLHVTLAAIAATI